MFPIVTLHRHIVEVTYWKLDRDIVEYGFLFSIRFPSVTDWTLDRHIVKYGFLFSIQFLSVTNWTFLGTIVNVFQMLLPFAVRVLYEKLATEFHLLSSEIKTCFVI